MNQIIIYVRKNIVVRKIIRNYRLKFKNKIRKFKLNRNNILLIL